jgi:hypothetical protein
MAMSLDITTSLRMIVTGSAYSKSNRAHLRLECSVADALNHGKHGISREGGEKAKKTSRLPYFPWNFSVFRDSRE